MKFRLIPDFPGYRTIDRYILLKFLRTYVFGMVMVLIVMVVFDYVEKVDDFTELKAPTDAIINDYYLNFIPYSINCIINCYFIFFTTLGIKYFLH